MADSESGSPDFLAAHDAMMDAMSGPREPAPDTSDTDSFEEGRGAMARPASKRAKQRARDAMARAARTRALETSDSNDDFAEHSQRMDSMVRPALEPIRMPEKSRGELLRDAFTNEALKRMARKAEVGSVSQKGSLKVNDELRSIADLML